MVEGTLAHRKGRKDRKEKLFNIEVTRIVFPEDVCLTTVVKTNESGFSLVCSATYSLEHYPATELDPVV